jgi:proteasome accessory factor B
LLRKLCARNAAWTLRELAGEFEVSPKTIQRDLNLLRGVGFPLKETVGPRGLKSWRCDTGAILSGLTFTFEEVAALYLGRRFLEPLAGTLLWDAAQSAFRKIRAGLGSDALTYLEQLATAFHKTAVGVSDYSERAEQIDLLMVAIEDCRIARVLYHSLRSDLPATVVLHPHGLINHRAALYLVAYVPDHEEMRHYKVDRLRDVELLTGERFQRIDGFDLQQHLTTTFGIYHGGGKPFHIRIRFAPEAARYVEEHRWHASQKLTRQTDGSVVLELELSRLEEVKSWVLSFGAKAMVEEPEELRGMMGEDARLLSSSYMEKGKAAR